MKTHLRVTAAGLILLAATACQSTTEGTVAMTTEPGPPITSSPETTGPTVPGLPNLPDFPIPGIELPTPKTDLPEVPAPPNSSTMACSEFNDLDDATQLAVIRAILASENNPLGPDGEGIGQILAEAACQFLPDSTVNDVLLGGSPP